MAKQPKKQRMKALSWLTFLSFVGLVTAAVLQIRQDDVLTGAELIGWALLSLAIFLGFTCPNRCRVETSRHTACKNDAYGFLFGCQGYGHWLARFLIRVRLRRGELKPVKPREPAASAFMYQPTEQTKPMKVIIEDTARSKFGFWIALISMVAGVGQVVIAIISR